MKSQIGAGIPKKSISESPEGGGSRCRNGRCWKGYSMFCEPVVSGKRFPKNMGRAAVYINISRSGRQRDSLKRFGQKDWKNMMKWKESAGNGRVWTAAW